MSAVVGAGNNPLIRSINQAPLLHDCNKSEGKNKPAILSQSAHKEILLKTCERNVLQRPDTAALAAG
ncbi:MAG TPA: hypothetical protein DCS26_04805 [Porticoccaceae bacterium]|nr:hypothetical protein [Porticoccaceae bacterium]